MTPISEDIERLFGSSPMASLVIHHDWSSSVLGPIAQWPETLITAVSICLNSRFPMCVRWGEDLICIYNDAYSPILGKKHPAALGRPMKDIWPEIWDQLYPQFEQVQKEGIATWNERVHLLIDRSGYPEDAWFTWSYSPIKDFKGNIVGLFCACTEDTYFMRAEAKLQRLLESEIQAQRRDHFLVSLDDRTRPLSDPVEIIAANAELLGRFLDVDRCAYAEVEEDEDWMNLTGNYTRDESIRSIVGRLKFSDFGEEVHNLMRAGRPYVVNDIDTHSPPVNKEAYRQTQIQAVICVPLLKNNKFVAAMAVHMARPRVWRADEVELLEMIANRCWESIERARVARSLQESERKAKEASAAKTDFLANMSHEIRTPMNAVIGITNILMQTDSNEKNRIFLSTLKTSADQLMTLINDMLDFSRIEAGKIELEHNWFDPNELLRDCLSVISVEARRKSLAVYSHEDWPLFTMVKGDQNRVRQIVMNLLSNAVKFTNQGRISVNSKLIEGEGRHYLEICVKDTGIGMSADTLGSIFDKFTQADSSISRKFGGTGLGLAISKSLAKLMSGDLSVESEPGQGSTFTLSLPVEIHNERAESAATALPSMSAKSQGHILLVEDNDTNILVATNILDMLGYSYDVAKSGLEAVEKRFGGDYDAILMDLQMPGMDGYETTRRIRIKEIEDGSFVPIIAMTAHAFNDHKEQCFAAGMNDFLPKPFQMEMLSEKIEHQRLTKRVA